MTPPADPPPPRRRRSVTRAGGPPTPTVPAQASEPPEHFDPIDAEDRRRMRRKRSRDNRAAFLQQRRGAAYGLPPEVQPTPAASSSGRAPTAGDRKLRGLEASRHTQVSPSVALRARDWAMPTADDFAEAEESVRLVRRGYVPPTPLHNTRRDHRRDSPGGNR